MGAPVGVVPAQSANGQVRVEEVSQRMEDVPILLDLPGDQQDRRGHVPDWLQSKFDT